MDEQTADTYVTVGEAARRLGISVDTARRWCDNGTLETHRTANGHRRIALRSIDAVKRGRAGRSVGAAAALADIDTHTAVLAVHQASIDGGWRYSQPGRLTRRAAATETTAITELIETLTRRRRTLELNFD
jgi:excisionase family DNA binding protein